MCLFSKKFQWNTDFVCNFRRKFRLLNYLYIIFQAENHFRNSPMENSQNACFKLIKPFYFHRILKCFVLMFIVLCTHFTILCKKKNILQLFAPQFTIKLKYYYRNTFIVIVTLNDELNVCKPF